MPLSLPHPGPSPPGPAPTIPAQNGLEPAPTFSLAGHVRLVPVLEDGCSTSFLASCCSSRYVGDKLDEVGELEKLEDDVRRGGLGPMGGLWVQAAAENRVHEAEVLDPERIEIPAGTPALLTREEADDVLEVLDLVTATASEGPGRSRCEELALLLRQRLRQAGL